MVSSEGVCLFICFVTNIFYFIKHLKQTHLGAVKNRTILGGFIILKNPQNQSNTESHVNGSHF